MHNHMPRHALEACWQQRAPPAGADPACCRPIPAAACMPQPLPPPPCWQCITIPCHLAAAALGGAVWRGLPGGSSRRPHLAAGGKLGGSWGKAAREGARLLSADVAGVCSGTCAKHAGLTPDSPLSEGYLPRLHPGCSGGCWSGGAGGPPRRSAASSGASRRRRATPTSGRCAAGLRGLVMLLCTRPCLARVLHGLPYPNPTASIVFCHLPPLSPQVYGVLLSQQGRPLSLSPPSHPPSPVTPSFFARCTACCCSSRGGWRRRGRCCAKAWPPTQPTPSSAWSGRWRRRRRATLVRRTGQRGCPGCCGGRRRASEASLREGDVGDQCCRRDAAGTLGEASGGSGGALGVALTALLPLASLFF